MNKKDLKRGPTFTLEQSKKRKCASALHNTTGTKSSTFLPDPTSMHQSLNKDQRKAFDAVAQADLFHSSYLYHP